MHNHDFGNNSTGKNITRIIVIFEHAGSLIELDKSFLKEVYRIEDKRLYESKIIMDLELFPRIFLDNFRNAVLSDKKIFYIYYHPSVAACANLMREYLSKNMHAEIIGLAFFHSDEDSSQRSIENEDGKHSSMLDKKKMLLESMERFPFIKRFTVPVGFSINTDYMNKLLTEMV